MDNQARRCGLDGVMTVEGVDLISYLVRELRAMAEIAAETGRPDEAEDFHNHAEKLSRLINDVFWDDADGFYYDHDERRNERVKIKSMALWELPWRTHVLRQICALSENLPVYMAAKGR